MLYYYLFFIIFCHRLCHLKHHIFYENDHFVMILMIDLHHVDVQWMEDWLHLSHQELSHVRN